MKWLQYDSPLFRFLGRIADLMIVNVMFLVFSIPIVTIGASATAMYTVLFRLADDTCGGVIVTFWNAFRENFKKSTLLFLILLVPIILVLYELWFYNVNEAIIGRGILNTVLFAIPVLIVTFTVSYCFPLTAFFENTIGNTLKNALLMAIAHLPVSLLMAFLNLLPIILLYFVTEFFLRMLFLFLLLGFAAIAYANALLLRQIFKRYIPKEEDELPPSDEEA